MTIRVLHVLEALEGGTARHLVDVVRYTSGVEPHVVLPTSRGGGVTDTAAPGAMAAAGATVHHVEMRRDPRSPRNVKALVSVRLLIRRLHPEVVHGHSSIGGVVARIAATGTAAATVYTPNGIAPGRGPWRSSVCSAGSPTVSSRSPGARGKKRCAWASSSRPGWW